MRGRYIQSVIILVVIAALAGPALASKGGGSSGGSDSIWIVSPSGAAPTNNLSYGGNFNAGYSSKASSAWGLLQCTANSSTVLASPTTGYILQEYRATQADGTIGVFNLSDPMNHEWLGGGANCTVSLVVSQGGKSSVTASTNLTVS